MQKNKTGFTLVEVLVTLAIIGVVAALSIPNLIQNSEKQRIVTGVRKAQSLLSHAYTSFVADGTSMEKVFADDDAVITLNYFATKLNIVKNCGTGTGCFPNVVYTDMRTVGNFQNINNDTDYGKAILADGSDVFIVNMSPNCDYDGYGGSASENPLMHKCGEIGIDINGFRPPNKVGKDLFFFHVTRAGIYPFGSNSDSSGSCSLYGYSCAVRVLRDGVVNYY